MTLAKPLAPEEILLGDFVAVLRVVAELPSFLWCTDAATLPLHEPIRVPFVPAAGGIPLKVRAICLPFVLVKHPEGVQRTLDVRQYRLARLDAGYAAAAWKAHKQSNKKRRRKHRRHRLNL